jgi:hypothetical protein
MLFGGLWGYCCNASHCDTPLPDPPKEVVVVADAQSPLMRLEFLNQSVLIMGPTILWSPPRRSL